MLGVNAYAAGSMLAVEPVNDQSLSSEEFGDCGQYKCRQRHHKDRRENIIIY